MYECWSNASDYRSTEESFDIIALHSIELHQALKEQWKTTIKKAQVKLTGDQKYMCKATGVDLPFLPFATIEERKQFAKCVLDPSFPKSEEEASIRWCKFVDGVNIFLKLPVHIRNYRDQFDRFERVRQSVENAREGKEKLNELNAALTDKEERATQSIERPASMRKIL